MSKLLPTTEPLYLDQPHVSSHISQLADQIITDFQPDRVLALGPSAPVLAATLSQTDVTAMAWPTSAVEPLVSAESYDLIVIFASGDADDCPLGLALSQVSQQTDAILLLLPDSGEVTFGQAARQSWVTQLAQFGFVPSFDTTALPDNGLLFRGRPLDQAIAAYDSWVQHLATENRQQQTIIVQQQRDLSQQQLELARQREELLATQTRLTRFEGSLAYTLIQSLQSLRAHLMPPGSVRDQLLDQTVRALATRNWSMLAQIAGRTGQEVAKQGRAQLWRQWLRHRSPQVGRFIRIEPISNRPPIESPQASVEIIICVHDALADLRRCLISLEQHSTTPYALILVDDGSEAPTREFLAEFAQARPNVTLLRNDVAQGYTRAANQGLQYSSADYVILLNSDTIVTPDWLDRLIACAESEPQIGLVGPLSNAATWQSIPEVGEDGQWSDNPLPLDLTVDQIAQSVARYAGRLYPSMPFLNGFCLLIKRQLIGQIGYFDEENFGSGYGEENDYVLRARQAGWHSVLADDTYIYHAQSRSYSHDRRRRLSEQAAVMLAKKHGAALIRSELDLCKTDRVLQGIRARSRVVAERQDWLRRGAAQFGGKRVLFVLPIVQPGGGGHVIIHEAQVMRQMEVQVELFNLVDYQSAFQRSHPDLDLPVRYGRPQDLVLVADQYDAVVATANFVPQWLLPLVDKGPVLGYYVQEFEPHMYAPHSDAYRTAFASYTLIPNMVRFTKTNWTRREVKTHTGADCAEVGISVDLDFFRPRPRPDRSNLSQPLRVVAMVRPRPAYRQAGLTMQVLREISRVYGSDVETIIFGVTLDDPAFAELPHDFAWYSAGILVRSQVAALLNQADIFVDYSAHQAMGLTALEAMACGAAVVVPADGGATSFARDEENSLVVDTSSPTACIQALRRLLEDHNLRLRLQRQAVTDVCHFFPERPAFNILQTLFASEL